MFVRSWENDLRLGFESLWVLGSLLNLMASSLCYSRRKLMPADKLWPSPRLGDEHIDGARAQTRCRHSPTTAKQPHTAASTLGVTEHPVWCLSHRCLLRFMVA